MLKCFGHWDGKSLYMNFNLDFSHSIFLEKVGINVYPWHVLLLSLLRCAMALNMATRAQQDSQLCDWCNLSIKHAGFDLRPFVSHIKSMQRKKQKELEKAECPQTPPPKAVKQEPKAKATASGRKGKWNIGVLDQSVAPDTPHHTLKCRL